MHMAFAIVRADASPALARQKQMACVFSKPLIYWRARQDLNHDPLMEWTLPSRCGVNCAKVEV